MSKPTASTLLASSPLSVINRQLIPSILALNYGDTDEAPSAKFLEDEVADYTEAQRDKVLVDAGLRDWRRLHAQEIRTFRHRLKAKRH